MYYNSGALEHLQYKGGKFNSTIYLLEPDSFNDISSIVKKKKSNLHWIFCMIYWLFQMWIIYNQVISWGETYEVSDGQVI